MPVSKKEISECPIDAMLSVIDGRWKGTILWRLSEGPMRTSELRRSIPGITERMLIQAFAGTGSRRNSRAPTGEDGSTLRMVFDFRLWNDLGAGARNDLHVGTKTYPAEARRQDGVECALRVENAAPRLLYTPSTLLPHWSVDTQTVVILDFGSQYTQLIARRIREQNVFSVVLPCTAPLSEIQKYKPIGLILSGGPSSVYDADAPDADPQVLALGRADARRLLRTALHCASYGRQGAICAEARVRPRGSDDRGYEDAAVRRIAGDDAGVDEPRRRSAGTAGGISPDCRYVERAGRDRERGR